MLVPTWLRPLAARLNLTRTRRTPRRPAFCPRLEGLEDRAAPSVTPVTDIGSTRLTPVDSWLYFVGDDPVNGHRVWRTNGQPGGTTLVGSGGRPVMDNFTGDFDVHQPVLLAAGHYLYFFTADGGDRFTLWRNYSVTGVSQELRTFAALDEWHTLPYGLTACGQDVYFVANVTASDTPDPNDTDGWGYEVWKTDGATGATAPYKDVLPGPDSAYPYLAAAGTQLYYNDAQGFVWGVTDTGTGAATPVLGPGGNQIQAWLYPATGDWDQANYGGYLTVGSDLYLAVFQGADGTHLWRITSPTATAEHISDLEWSTDGVKNYGYAFTVAQSAIYFVDQSITGDYRLWKCEGSTVTLLKSGLFGTSSFGVRLDPRMGLTRLAITGTGTGTDVYYSGTNSPQISGVDNDRVGKYDGLTGNVSIIARFPSAEDPALICTAGSTLYFSDGYDTVWQTDGTVAGTFPVPNFPSRTITGTFLGNQGVFSAVVGSTTYFSAGGLWRVNNPPVAALSGPTTAVAGQTLTFSLTATDPDQDPIASFDIDWDGDGTPDQTINGPSGATVTQTFATPGPYAFQVRARDAYDAGDWASYTVTVGEVSAPNLQSVLTPGGTVTIATTTNDDAQNVLDAVNGLLPDQTPAATLNLQLSGKISSVTVNAPSNLTLYIKGVLTPAGTTVDPDVPALVVNSGNVIVSNVTFTESGDAPTILVTGGHLTLRNDVIQESTGYNRAAIEVTGGTVDLGTAADPGGNTININGTGASAQNTTATPIAAVGDTFTVNGLPLAPSALSGTVFEDFNGDGQIDFGERGIANVRVTLAGTDDLGNAVSQSLLTDSDGAYVFLGLRPGSYTITETQPAGYAQGIDSVGTAGGSLPATDQFLIPLGVEVNGLNYNFGERPAGTGPVQKGQTAGIGFWNNKNGQALILALNGGGTSTQLGDWLAATLPNMFGAGAGANNLAGKDNAYIAALFQRDFLQKGQKLDAQVLATALSVYATNATLDSMQVAANYGFIVSGDGVGAVTWNVGSNGDAFGVANNTSLTVMDLLLATDDQAVNGLLYNGNAARRNEANAVYSALNQAGSIS